MHISFNKKQTVILIVLLAVLLTVTLAVVLVASCANGGAATPSWFEDVLTRNEWTLGRNDAKQTETPVP